VASSWIVKRHASDGTWRYLVRYRVGGRDTRDQYAGSFRREADAKTRRRWVEGELAAMRLPDLRMLEQEPQKAPTLRDAAARWLQSRIDVADHTRLQHRSDVNRAGDLLDRRLDEIRPADIAELVAKLAEAGKRRETIRKTVMALAMIFDHAAVEPNPARDKRTVKLPRGERTEIKPPTAGHVLAVHRLLPERYRLALLTLDDTGMRLSELERLTWGDVDEQRGRWRVSAAVSKTSRARWVKVSPIVFAAVMALCPRDDRAPDRRVFQGFGGDRFRTAIARACTAAGVPTFSPHDLRHRRISLLLREEDPVTVARLVGHARASMSLDTYGHVLPDESEIAYADLLPSDSDSVHAPVHARGGQTRHS
jgi:integrase